MAKKVSLRARIKLDGDSYSDQAAKIEVKRTQAEVGVTTAGDDGKEKYIPGMEVSSLSVDWIFDGANVLDKFLWDKMDAREEVSFEAWQDTDTTADINPKFTGSFFVLEYLGISGAPGEARKQSVTYKVNGGLTRAEV
jgi:hypothetical protein